MIADKSGKPEGIHRPAAEKVEEKNMTCVLMEIKAFSGGKNPQGLQITAARMEPVKFIRRRSFSAYVRLKDLTLANWKTAEYLRNVRPSMMDAKPCGQVFKKLKLWLSEDDFLYCWDDSTRSVFQKLCRKFGFRECEVKTLRDGGMSGLYDMRTLEGFIIETKE